MEGEENDSRKLIPGDLLWTKIGKYPFWPCMIAYDPSSGDYYREIKSKDKVYIIYHVQYFGNNPLRGWTSRRNTLLYEGRQKFLSRIYDISEKNKYAQSLYNVPQYYKRDWENAISEAEEALEVADVKERFASFVFSYENVKKKSLKTMHETSSADVVENSQEVEQDRKKKKMKSTFKKKNLKLQARILQKKNPKRTSCDILKTLNRELIVRIEKIPSCPLALKEFIAQQCGYIDNGSNVFNAQNNEDKNNSNNNESCIPENVSLNIQGSSCDTSEYMASDKADNNMDKSAQNNNMSWLLNIPPTITITQLRKFEKYGDCKLSCKSWELQLKVVQNVQNRNSYHNLHTCRKYNKISISDQAPVSKWSNYRPPGDPCGTDDDTEDSEEDDDDNSPDTLPGHVVSISKNYIYNYPIFHRCAEYNTKKGCRCFTCAICNSEKNIDIFCFTCPSSFCNDCRRTYAPLLFYIEDAPFLQRFMFYCQICAVKRCQDFIYKK